MSKKKVIGGVIVAIAAVLAAGYFGGRYYFTSHFYPKTTINGVDVSFKTESEALDLVKGQLDRYALGIKSDTETMTLSAEQVGLEYTQTDDVGEILVDQDVDRWFMHVLNVHDETAMGEQLDEDKMKAAVDALSCMNPANPQAPVDAKIEYNTTQQAFVIVNEIIGNTVEPEKLYAGVEKAMLSGETMLDLTTNEYYVQPKYTSTSSEVVQAMSTIEKYMATVINYEDSDLTYTLDKSSIHDFIKVSKDMKVTLDKAVIKKYINDKISPVFNTVGDERTIDSPGSGTFTASGGTYGWQVGLIAERTQMIKDIESGKTVTREPMYLQDAASKDRDNDIGDTYVDVNIDDQHLWYVKDGKVELESDFVSGNVSTGHATSKGIYMVERKERNYRMEDYNVTVKYWMPFNVDLGEGFHDASWRGNFGGSIYKTDGSHGCINLPPSVAKKLYQILPTRCPVIVH